MPPERSDDELDARCRPEIDAAWDRIEARVAELPPSLAALGRRYLAGRGPGGAYRAYFSSARAAPLVYLPLWLRAALERRGEWPPDPGSAFLGGVLCAAMWGYFYIRIQDDLLDEEAPGDDVREALLFGNVCVHEMTRLFGEATAGSPAFGASFERAWLTFSARTLEERAQLLSDAPYPRELFEAHAAKVAFAEAPLVAVCLRAGRDDLIPAITGLVEALGVAHGLLNDASGFACDARNRHRTYLLARAGWTHAASPPGGDDALAAPHRARLYEGGLLREIHGEAREAFERAREAGRALGMDPELAPFAALQLRLIEEAERQIFVLSLQRALAGRA